MPSCGGADQAGERRMVRGACVMTGLFPGTCPELNLSGAEPVRSWYRSPHLRRGGDGVQVPGCGERLHYSLEPGRRALVAAIVTGTGLSSDVVVGIITVLGATAGGSVATHGPGVGRLRALSGDQGLQVGENHTRGRKRFGCGHSGGGGAVPAPRRLGELTTLPSWPGFFEPQSGLTSQRSLAAASGCRIGLRSE